MSTRKAFLLGGLLVTFLFVVLLVTVGVFVPSDESVPESVAEPAPTATATMTPTAIIPTAVPTVTATALPTTKPPPTPTSSATATPRPTRVPTPTPRLGIGRGEVYERFKSLNIGLLPLNRHTDDWFSTQLPNADIIIDIFGTANRTEAIETTFSLNSGTSAGPVVRVALQMMLGDDWQDSEAWVIRNLGTLSVDREKIQTKMGGMYLTLYLIPKIQSVMFSVDSERQ